MDKKGDKSLQMIFSLFILVIVAFVILNLFFNWVEIFGTKTKPIISKTEQKAIWQNFKNECNKACTSDEGDRNAAIEFCAKIVEIDIDNNNLVANEKASYGVHDFCEDKVPCFIVTNEHDCKITGTDCRKILMTYRPTDYYQRLYSKDGTGGCGLDPQSPNNWITKYGFNETP